ncbi:MAG: hypothetical protein IGS39_25170 [Calothrix sp. C42_A2020_038]|nr:hypothetical protein [Calothrix sp. C42_A2020_038]
MATTQILIQNFLLFWGAMTQAHLFKQPISVFPKAMALAIFAGLTSCSNLSFSSMNAIGANITPIKQLTPQQKNATVYIQGKVEKHIPLLDKQAYQLNDSTGSIIVLTNQKGLSVGSQAVFKGQIRYKSIPLAGQEQGEVYIEEK